MIRLWQYPGLGPKIVILNRREWWRAVGGGRGGPAESGNHIKFPCYFRNQYGESMDIHVLDFKCKSVNFDNLFWNKIFGLQLFGINSILFV